MSPETSEPEHRDLSRESATRPPDVEKNMTAKGEVQAEKRQEAQAAERSSRAKEAVDLKNIELGLTPIDQLISEAQVSEEQKQAWREMAKLDVPKEAKIKVVAVIGAQGLDTSGEAALVEATFKQRYKNVDFVLISNDQPREAVVRQLGAEMQSGGYDVIMPYFSAHGGTRSVAGEVEPGAANDTFTVFNGQEKMLEGLRTQATSEAKRLATEQAGLFIDPTTNEFKAVPEGTTLAFNGGSVRIPRGLDLNATRKVMEENNRGLSIEPTSESVVETALADLIFNKLMFDSEQDLGITSNDMLAMQEGSKSDFIYFFDNCHAGSANDDALARAGNTRAILSAASIEQSAYQYQGNGNRGAFMEKVFTYMSMDCGLGEAFVRSDMELNMSGDMSQDPKATIRTDTGVLQVASVSGAMPVFPNAA